MGRATKTASIAACLAWAVAALTGGSRAEPAPVVVFVSVPPQASVVRAVGGPRVVVHSLVRPGLDPHLFEPTPKQVRSLGRAKLFLKVGMPFEKPLLEKVRGHLPDMEIVDAAAGFTRRPACNCGHDHGEDRADGDPHVWLSPGGLKAIVKNTTEALVRAEPAHAADFRRRARELAASIDVIDAANRAKLAPHRGRAVYVFHPAFGYFCDAYGLKQKAVELHGRAPSARYLRELVGQARKDGARVVFVQEQFDQHAAKIVADAVGARLVTLDPLAEDAVANLRRIADAIASGSEDH